MGANLLKHEGSLLPMPEALEEDPSHAPVGAPGEYRAPAVPEPWPVQGLGSRVGPSEVPDGHQTALNARNAG